MISSLDAVQAINDVRGDAVAVGAMTPNRYWESVTENPDLDLPIFGGMGKASSVALGMTNRPTVIPAKAGIQQFQIHRIRQ